MAILIAPTIAANVLGALGIKKALGKRPKTPKKTGEQLATEKRQRLELDKVIGKQEDLFKLLSSRKLGRASFLSGSPRTAEEAAVGGSGSGGRGLGRSLLPGSPRTPGSTTSKRFPPTRIR